MFETLRGLGYKANQKLIMLSDGGESVRTLGRRIGPEAEHQLDWFHVAMRVTALGQMVKGATPDDRWRDERLSELDRAKYLLWNGHAGEAEEAIGWIEEAVEAELGDAVGERRSG